MKGRSSRTDIRPGNAGQCLSIQSIADYATPYQRQFYNEEVGEGPAPRPRTSDITDKALAIPSCSFIFTNDENQVISSQAMPIFAEVIISLESTIIWTGSEGGR